jgi:hypothetical protein
MQENTFKNSSSLNNSYYNNNNAKSFLHCYKHPKIMVSIKLKVAHTLGGEGLQRGKDDERTL